MIQEPRVIDKLVSFDEDTDGSLVIHHNQYIPDEFISQLKRDKINPDHNPAGEFMLAASIPVVVVERLLSEGFDVFQEPVRKTLSKLRAMGLDAFITTNKSI